MSQAKAEAEAKALRPRPRPRPKVWPRGHFGLQDLTSPAKLTTEIKVKKSKLTYRDKRSHTLRFNKFSVTVSRRLSILIL